jgi:alpha-ketoglutarate-dependent taurine dioxygenase
MGSRLGPAVSEGFLDGGARGPLIVRPHREATPERLVELIAIHRHDLRERLAWAGAVLFRGFGARDAGDLARAVRAFSDGPALAYVGGDTPRTRVGDGVYTSTEAPAGVRIPLHSEMSYQARHPRHLFFLCVQPAARGGETTLADTRAVFAALAPSVRARFMAHGVRYLRVIRGPSRAFELLEHVASASKSWMDVFETERREEAEARCRELALDYRWLPSGHLVTSTVQPAAITHAATGEPIWFNQAHLFCFSPRWMGRLYYALALALYPRPHLRTHQAQYGDGSAIAPETLAHVHDVLDGETVACAWQRGDLLVVDNETCMHGRNAFSGARRVLVAMTPD